jgi:hypothetical protein
LAAVLDAVTGAVLVLVLLLLFSVCFFITGLFLFWWVCYVQLAATVGWLMSSLALLVRGLNEHAVSKKKTERLMSSFFFFLLISLCCVMMG